MLVQMQICQQVTTNILGLMLKVASKSHIDHRNRFGSTPLHEAAKLGNLRACRKLVKAGAELHPLDMDGKAPLDLAPRNSAAKRFIEKAIRRGRQKAEKDEKAKETHFDEDDLLDIDDPGSFEESTSPSKASPLLPGNKRVDL